MFTGIFDPAFLQAASAHAAQPTPPEPEPDGIVIRTNTTGNVNPIIKCTGTITVKSIYNGEPQEATYTDIDEAITINADADTDIIITGKVTELATAPAFSNKITSFRALNSQLVDVTVGTQSTTLTTLCLPSTLTTFGGTITSVTKIMYPANNSVVSNAIKNAITNATAADGVVYLDEDGDYYDTIANAATAKGWTVEQLPA